MTDKQIQELAEEKLTMMFMGNHETYIRSALIAFGKAMYQAVTIYLLDHATRW
jgi:hypothetical protein